MKISKEAIENILEKCKWHKWPSKERYTFRAGHIKALEEILTAGPEVHGWNRCLGSEEIEKVYKNMIAGMECNCDFCNFAKDERYLIGYKAGVDDAILRLQGQTDKEIAKRMIEECRKHASELLGVTLIAEDLDMGEFINWLQQEDK